jgi:hypothetical protein
VNDGLVYTWAWVYELDAWGLDLASGPDLAVEAVVLVEGQGTCKLLWQTVQQAGQPRRFWPVHPSQQQPQQLARKAPRVPLPHGPQRKGRGGKLRRW